MRVGAAQPISGNVEVQHSCSQIFRTTDSDGKTYSAYEVLGMLRGVSLWRCPRNGISFGRPNPLGKGGAIFSLMVLSKWSTWHSILRRPLQTKSFVRTLNILLNSMPYTSIHGTFFHISINHEDGDFSRRVHEPIDTP